VSGANPLLLETLRGIGRPARAQLDYLNYLVVQAVVVFAWWPKDGLLEVLGSGDAPHTLLAAVLAAGVLVSYYAVRAGAEEVLLEGQHGLREWTAASPLPVSRILAGYLQGQVVHALHLMSLSSPLVLMAFAVSGGEWIPLAWSFAAILFQATFYRLLGAVVYLAIGHHGAITFLAIRLALLLVYALGAALLPVASHLVLSARLLSLDGPPPVGIGPVPGPIGFVALYLLASAALTAVLHRQLSRREPDVAAGPAAP
jgi:hypothetical protein